MFTIKQRPTDSLYAELRRLMYDVDAVERGACWCTQRVYDRMLQRLCVVDRELNRRARERAGEMPGNSNLPEVGRRDK